MGKTFVFVELRPEWDSIFPPLCATHPTKAQITDEEWQEILAKAEPKYETLFGQFKAVSDEIDEEMQREGLKVSDVNYTRIFLDRLRARGVEPFKMRQAIAQVLREEGFEVIEDVDFFIYQDPTRVSDPAYSA